MSSTKIIPLNNLHCTIEGHGDFIRPTDISYKKYPSIIRHSRPPCNRKVRRNADGLKNSSVEQIQRTSSYQNLSEIQNKDHELCKNSKSCENIAFIGKQFSIGLRRKPQTKIMNEAEEKPQAMKISAEGDTQPEKNREEEVIMREALTNFVINAWRNLSKETAKLKAENELLKKQETELGVVKQQYEDECRKSANLRIEIMQSKLTAITSLRKIEKLKSASLQQKQELDDWRKRLDEKQIECENSKNKCLEFENEIDSLREKLDEEREQTGKLQEKQINLSEKVRCLESAAVERDAALLEENSKLKRELSAKEWEIERHRTVISDMERFLNDKEENIAAIQKVSEAYMMEVTKIRLSGGDAAKTSKRNEDNLSMASNVVRTAVFFMLPVIKKLLFP